MKSQPWKAHQEFFRKLLYARRGDLPPAHVFTTNYDLAIERALDGSGVDYFDGFKGTIQRSFHPETYSQALYVAPGPYQRRLLPVPSTLYYYKLHGSINWRFANVDNRRTIIQVSVPTHGDDGLAVIYPTQDKELETLGFPYADLFRSFSDTLQSSDVGMITIGYGFHDSHINRIINAALDTNYSLQVLIVDPAGVYENCSIPSDELVFKTAPIADLVKQADARISCVTGDCSKFASFASVLMPDLNVDSLAEPGVPRA